MIEDKLTYRRKEAINWNSETVRKFLLQKKFTPTELAYFDTQKLSIDAIIEATNLFREKSWHDYTQEQLAMLFFNKQWDNSNPATLRKRISKLIQKEYGKESKEHPELNLSATNLLRIKTNNYQGNLLEIKGYEFDKNACIIKTKNPLYEKVLISSEDWRTGIRLPEKIDEDLIEYLGILWGCADLDRRLQRKDFTLRLNGDKSRKNLFEIEIPNLFKKYHNTNVKHEPQNAPKEYVEELNGIYGRKGYVIKKSSLAITTWLIYELNFGLGKNIFPPIKWNNKTIDRFVIGIIKSTGHLSSMNNCVWQRITIKDQDYTFLINIKKLLESKGNKPGKVRSSPTGIGDNGYALSLNKNDSKYFLRRLN